MRHSKTPKTGLSRDLSYILIGDEFAVPFIEVTHEHGTYFVPKYAEHRPASRAILKGGLYEPQTHDLVDKIMQKKSGSMIHAGTFFGDMLPTFARSCTAIVYAFEPVLENYVLAKACIQKNKLENVFLQNAGLSQKTSISHINTGIEGQTHLGGASQLSDEGQIVGLMTIDSLDLDDVVIIQLDVEGHELAALKGARATIERTSPIVMIEDNEQACNAFLEELGYSHIRNIPGLGIWTRPVDQAIIEGIIPHREILSSAR